MLFIYTFIMYALINWHATEWLDGRSVIYNCQSGILNLEDGSR